MAEVWLQVWPKLIRTELISLGHWAHLFIVGQCCLLSDLYEVRLNRLSLSSENLPGGEGILLHGS